MAEQAAGMAEQAEMEPTLAPDVSAAAAMVHARALAEEEGAAAPSVCRALHKSSWVSPSEDCTAVLAERSVRDTFRRSCSCSCTFCTLCSRSYPSPLLPLPHPPTNGR